MKISDDMRAMAGKLLERATEQIEECGSVANILIPLKLSVDGKIIYFHTVPAFENPGKTARFMDEILHGDPPVAEGVIFMSMMWAKSITMRAEGVDPEAKAREILAQYKDVKVGDLPTAAPDAMRCLMILLRTADDTEAQHWRVDPVTKVLTPMSEQPMQMMGRMSHRKARND